MRRLAPALVLVLVFAAAAGVRAQGPPITDFTDWTSYTATQAVGTLAGTPVRLNGEIGPGTKVDGTEANFNNPAFSPPLTATDSLQVRSNATGNPYQFAFDGTVTNPVIDIGNLYSTLTFEPGVTIQKVSGDGGLTVSGTTVSGGPRSGGNGTIRVLGRFDTLGFTATSAATTLDPVFYLQLGAPRGSVNPPRKPPKPAATPNWVLFVNEGGDESVQVPPGGQSSIEIRADRNAASSGRIKFSLSDLPKGLTATIEPEEVTGTGSSRARLTVRAAKKLKPQKRNLKLTATAVDPTVGPSYSADVRVDVLGQLAVQLKGIEITQGVQTFDQPTESVYGGVILSQFKKTVVRVFPGLKGRELKKGKNRPPFSALLYGEDYRGRQLPGSPLSPVAAPDPTDVRANSTVLTRKERTSPSLPATFVIPPSWRQGTLNLTAKAVAAESPYYLPRTTSVLCTRVSCGARIKRSLLRITFRRPPVKRINALLIPAVYPYDDRYPFQGRIEQPSAKAPEIFQKLVRLYPGQIQWLDRNNKGSITPRYRGVEYGNYKQLLEPAQTWDTEIGSPGIGTIGIYTQGDNPGVTVGRVGVASGRSDNGVMWRPITSVAHEVFHLFGFPHASPACGSGGEAWPVAEGRMNGVGLDPTTGSGGRKGPFRVINDGYDLMSYCGVTAYDAPHWISVYNWNRAMRQSGTALPPVRATDAAARDLLAVRAQVAGGSVTIGSVAHVTEAVTPAAGSAYRLVARDAGGRVLATAPLSQAVADGGAGATPITQLSGQVPRSGVRRVDIVNAAGAVLATRSGSAARPAVKITAPGKGKRVGGAAIPVRWTTSGADARSFTAVLETSSDGGRSYQRIWAGPNGGRASIPIGLTSASRNARLRLTVGDGFQETTATSARFTIRARRPDVQIEEPTRGQRVDAGGGARLFGSATDDQGRAITGRRLVWTAGKTVLGRGADIVAGLPAGTRKVRLTATARGGRKGSATVSVKVRSTVPFFSTLKTKRSGRAVILTVAATQPARLSVKGKRYRVGAKARRIRVKAGKSRSLKLTLSAGGKRSVNTVAVKRR